jgi:glycosyltransferase involved in cell wall biosynthesis
MASITVESWTPSHKPTNPSPDSSAWSPRGVSRDGRVRVGLIGPCLHHGGAEAWQLALARHTDPARITWLGCAVTGGDSETSPGMVAATSELMPVSLGMQAALDLARRCDLLVTWAVAGVDQLAASQPCPPRVIAVSHSPVESPWGHEVYGASKADRFVAVSELALSVLPADSKPTAEVIWNAVDPARLVVRRDRAAMLKTWGVPEGAKVAGYLGRLSAEKNPQAMTRLARSLPDGWWVVVVGDGCERGAMQSSRPGNLAVPGPDPAAGDVLAAFDVLVVPSQYESFGLTLAEGVWLGMPVVSTASGLAKLVPGISHIVPVEADGPTLAAAVLAALAEGPTSQAKALVPRLEPERFGREWTSLLLDEAGKTTLTALAKVAACPHRNGELPVSAYPSGCCSGPTLHGCKAGKGSTPGQVSTAECLACVSS